MSEGRNEADVQPNKLPPMSTDEVQARAQRMLDRYGKPPYKRHQLIELEGSKSMACPFELLLDDDIAILSDFVFYWLPYLVIKESK